MAAANQTGGDAGPKWQGLGTRIAAAAVLIPVVLAVTWLGGKWFVALVALVGIAAAYEWTRIAFDGSKVQFALIAIAVLIATVVAINYRALSSIALAAFFWSASLMAAGARGLKLNMFTFLGVPYIALPMAAIVQLRLSPEHGLVGIFWIFAVVWLADTLAYVFGRTIGGPKLAPVVSPNKTWAGLAGSVAGGALGSGLVAGFAGLGGIVPLVLLGGVFGIVGQIGDLYESAAKRRQGIKDSGAIIPGHGGVLDRIDALLAVSLAAFIVGLMRSGLDKPATGLLIW